VEIMIALAMKLRGFDVEFVICDGALSGCIQREVDKEPLERWEMQCSGCVQGGVGALESVGLSYVGIGELVLPQQRKELREVCQLVPAEELNSYEYRGVQVGMFAEASTRRYLKGLSLEGYEQVFREYLYSALVCTEAARVSLSRLEPNRLFIQNHIFHVGWAPMFRIAMGAGLPVILWGGGLYKDGGIALRPAKDTQFRSLHFMTDESWQQRAALPLTKEEHIALTAFLDDFYRKQRASTIGQSQRYRSRKELLRRLNITDNKPIWCIFPPISWGELADFLINIYPDVISWVHDTIRVINEIQEVTWLIKIHPAESKKGAVCGMESLIRRAFPEVDWDKRIIPSKSDILLQDLFPILSGGVTIRGTSGLELAIQGLPVILAGQAHYGGKGFTYEPSSREEYVELLRNASRLGPLSEEQRKLARQYAYSLFLQRKIPMNMGVGPYRFAPLDFRKLDLLLPGHDTAMDMICDRIIDGGEFIL
jgi:hypothetical protein